MGIHRAIGFLALLAAMGCHRPAAPEVVTTRQFVLQNETFSIRVPPGAEVQVDDQRGRARITIRPGTRTPSLIEIDLAEPAPSEIFDRSEAWPGSRLAYRTWLREGGSGGEEVMLEGRLTLGGRDLHIMCLNQDELFPEALTGWCLPYLRSLQVEGRR